MRLNHLVVRDFRNVREADLALAPGINVLWGANAQGKTNLLEAIHTLVTGRSFRARRERECIRRGGEDTAPEERAALVRAQVARRDGVHTLQIALQGSQRRVEIDGAPISKLAALWGQLNAVLFTPDDLQIVKGPPAIRRQFLDMEISQVRPSYLAWLQRFQAALSERTALVRAIGGGERRRVGEIDAWDTALAEASAEIHGHRRDVILRLEGHATQTHRAVSGGEETLRLLHRSFLAIQEPLTREECIELHREMLLEARATDIERGQTTVGPHRDDMVILLDDTEARVFASQGQQRAAVLALRLAEVTLMTEETGDPPLLLLDDIISELDPARRGRFFGQLPDDVQAVVTTVESPQMLEGVAIGQIFAVQSGEFTPLRHSDALMAKGA